jgi:hypothetical protein
VTKTTCCVSLVTNIQPSNASLYYDLQTCLRLRSINYSGLTKEVTEGCLAS